MDISAVKEHLTGQLHGGSLNKVRNFYAACERAANITLTNLDPIETERTAPLANVIHDSLNNYPLPSDFKKIIDLYPEENRTNLDNAQRVLADRFSLLSLLHNREITIEGSEGSKILRANWKSTPPVTFNAMDSLTSNGTWSVVGSASGLQVNSLYFVSGSGSIEFDLVASGDGIQNTTMSAIDVETWEQLADVIIPIYFGSVANLTSITGVWGENLTTKDWTGVAQTAQFDGTAFKTGWNYIRIPWSTATETGVVDNTKLKAFKLTVAATGAISDIRVDNIIFSLGRVFDIKYYSKYMFKNSAGTFISRPTSDSDTVVGDIELNSIFLNELLKECAQQMEGVDSDFDINYANKRLGGDLASGDPNMRVGLYAKYRGEFPSMSKKAVARWSGGPRFRK